LVSGIQEDAPNTAYFFLVRSGCRGRCVFCPQSTGMSESISRISWPEFPLDEVLDKLRGKSGFKRVCVQCAKEDGLILYLSSIVGVLREVTGLPISVSIPPASSEDLIILKDAGVEVLTIPLDCANERLFHKVKGRNWKDHWKALEKALGIFGPGRVGTHIIVGLGETEKDIVNVISKCHQLGILTSLFAFTPVRGTPLWGRPQPDLVSYRRLQLAKELIVSGRATEKDFIYNDLGMIRRIDINRETIEDVIEKGEAFMTRGCPGCNRPYFNEKVTGPVFNYPRSLKKEEVESIRREILGGIEGFKV